jgi:phosphatidylglycerophosphate synthase
VSAIRDVYFVYALVVVWGASALAYTVFGASRRSERVQRVGGSMLLGESVMNWTYWMTDPVVRTLIDLDITANTLTWASLVLGLGAGVALGFGWFGLACLLATCSTIGDILDGQVARLTHTGSDRGELLDAAVDRYTEAAFLAGLIIYFRDSIPLVLVCLAALHASMMVSYGTAKAEALRVEPPRGLMRRHERGAYLIVGVGLCPLIGNEIAAIVAVSVVAVVGNVAAIQKFARIGRALR